MLHWYRLYRYLSKMSFSITRNWKLLGVSPNRIHLSIQSATDK
ncbi:unnamed protein product [Strongylus vulgaris]|uniref:Uncharacterized protein n=1 Tax=Strongylus vulgaris TaxID=40348 RepID=A0A3P7IKY2_STRVU|nr:unnamed protein product [Strongylus vulgaris]